MIGARKNEINYSVFQKIHAYHWHDISGAACSPRAAKVMCFCVNAISANYAMRTRDSRAAPDHGCWVFSVHTLSYIVVHGGKSIGTVEYFVFLLKIRNHTFYITQTDSRRTTHSTGNGAKFDPLMGVLWVLRNIRNIEIIATTTAYKCGKISETVDQNARRQ